MLSLTSPCLGTVQTLTMPTYIFKMGCTAKLTFGNTTNQFYSEQQHGHDHWYDHDCQGKRSGLDKALAFVKVRQA